MVSVPRKSGSAGLVTGDVPLSQRGRAPAELRVIRVLDPGAEAGEVRGQRLGRNAELIRVLECIRVHHDPVEATDPRVLPGPDPDRCEDLQASLGTTLDEQLATGAARRNHASLSARRR